MRNPGERGLVVVDLGRVANESRVKHTTKRRMGQRARKGVVWAVLVVHGFFHAHFWGKSWQVRAKSPSAWHRPLAQMDMLSVAQLTESPCGRIVGLSLGINLFHHRYFLHNQTDYPPQLATIWWTAIVQSRERTPKRARVASYRKVHEKRSCRTGIQSREPTLIGLDVSRSSIRRWGSVVAWPSRAKSLID
jgi:hypothetical protein